MKRKFLYGFIILLYLSIPVNVFGIINTMVSLKYETAGGPEDCISGITGNNLCQAIYEMKIAAGLAFLLATMLLIFRKWILSKVFREH